MPAPAPFFSIIIVCRNPGPRLRTALESVWAQRDADYETLVIDGDSTDGTREWLTAQRQRISVLITEPDAGIYHAMNKGIFATSGTWVLFLGADDQFATDHVLTQAQETLDRTNAGVVVGSVNYDDGRVYRLATPPRPLRRNFVHHQAAFYRHKLLTETGGFDQSLHVMADYELNLRLWRQGTAFAPLSVMVAKCAAGGVSDSGAWVGYWEEIPVRHRHFPAWRCWFWDLVSVIRFLRKKFVLLFKQHG